MRYQEFIIQATQNAASEAFKYAKGVPADKLDWKPLEEGRSVIEICRELAMSPHWATTILQGGGLPSFDEGEPGPKLDTVEECEALCLQNLEAFYAVVRDFPDERLEEKYTLPFDGGQTITQGENMAYPHWNMTYHQGQIAYIQTLYGDKAMYW